MVLGERRVPVEGCSGVLSTVIPADIMSNILDILSRLVTARPYITIVVLLAVTVLLAAGTTLRAPPTEGADVAFLPPGHPVATATRDIGTLFGDSGEVSVATLIFRGNALTPEGLSQMNAITGRIAGDAGIRELLVPANPIVSPGLLVQAGLQVASLDAVSQAEIDAVRNVPQLQGALDAMTGTDEDGTSVAIATVSLINTGDERVKDAERRISELAAAESGPLSVSSLSPAIVEDEYREATETGMAPLIGLAGAAADRRSASAFHARYFRYTAHISRANPVPDMDSRS